MLINTDARLRALKIGFLVMSGLALLAIIPASRLPGSLPGELPSAAPPRMAGEPENLPPRGVPAPAT